MTDEDYTKPGEDILLYLLRNRGCYFTKTHLSQALGYNRETVRRNALRLSNTNIVGMTVVRDKKTNQQVFAYGVPQ